MTGPRQSGKTALLKHQFAGRCNYVSMEPPDVRASAIEDPRGFLEIHPLPLVIGEVQYAPDLFPYIKRKSRHRAKPPRPVSPDRFAEPPARLENHGIPGRPIQEGERREQHEEFTHLIERRARARSARPTREGRRGPLALAHAGLDQNL